MKNKEKIQSEILSKTEPFIEYNPGCKDEIIDFANELSSTYIPEVLKQFLEFHRNQRINREGFRFVSLEVSVQQFLEAEP